MREYGRRPGDTGGATYGTPWGRATTNRQSVVGVSLGHGGPIIPIPTLETLFIVVVCLRALVVMSRCGPAAVVRRGGVIGVS